MRLYLSSFGLGDEPEALVDLAPPGSRAAVVLNALDNFPAARSDWLRSQCEALAGLGFEPVELDLRAYFRAPSELASFLADMDLVWVNGGNAFILRRAMQQSGFDAEIRRRLDHDEMVYAGFSAAAVVAGPTLRGFELIDDPLAAPAGYDPGVVWDGLALSPVAIAVHFGAEDAQGEAMERVVRRLTSDGTPYLTLGDGQALIVDGEHRRVVGGRPGR